MTEFKVVKSVRHGKEVLSTLERIVKVGTICQKQRYFMWSLKTLPKTIKLEDGQYCVSKKVLDKGTVKVIELV